MTSSPSVPPPHYSTASTPTLLTTPLDNFFDIVPCSDATSFQVGYLGLDGFQAWVKGDVLIKLDERANQPHHTYRQCTISLIAEEVDQEQQMIPFFSATQVLWRNDSSPSASSSLAPSSVLFPPSTLPFSFPLTSDLPHCIHLPSSSLEYRLEATLQSSDENAMVSSFTKTLVHLTRYSRPGSLDQTQIEPHTWTIDTPTPMTVQLQRTLFRRAEPISVHLNIPPPDKKLLSLNLRSVEANLYRVIQGKDESERHELLLAHSGKLCRFHSTRSIVIRLTLHPPFDSSNMPYPHPDHDAALSGPINGRGGGGGCESISQETLLHRVSFVVKIVIGIRGEDGERRDVMLEKEIQVLPGAAGSLDVEEGGGRKKKGEAEQSSEEAGPSNLVSSPSAEEAVEEEYDGYEDVGRPLSEEGSEGKAQGPALDEDDGPPPTLLESRHDLQVAVEVAGVGEGVPRSGPSPVEGEYVWRQEDQSGNPVGEDDLPPPPPTPPVEEQNDERPHPEPHVGPHRPPPYMAQSLRTPRLGERPREDAHPPAYPHPPPSPFVSTPHPPSYEA